MMPNYREKLLQQPPGSVEELVHLLEAAYKEGAQDGVDFYQPPESALFATSRVISLTEIQHYAGDFEEDIVKLLEDNAAAEIGQAIFKANKHHHATERRDGVERHRWYVKVIRP